MLTAHRHQFSISRIKINRFWMSLCKCTTQQWWKMCSRQRSWKNVNWWWVFKLKLTKMSTRFELISNTCWVEVTSIHRTLSFKSSISHTEHYDEIALHAVSICSTRLLCDPRREFHRSIRSWSMFGHQICCA